MLQRSWQCHSVKTNASPSIFNVLTQERVSALNEHPIITREEYYKTDLVKGSPRQEAFYVCGCSRQQRCGKLENFLSLWKRNYLTQVDAENTAHLDEP